MPELKEGIPLHQPTAKVHKANKRPLYLGVGILVLVVVCFFWAYVKAGQRQTNVRGGATGRRQGRTGAGHRRANEFSEGV